MSVGFRPTNADDEIIQAHKRPGETTSDVLRRALRALDRERWQDEARKDMERISAGGEDLSDEPDDWGYDEDGRPVDLRGDRLVGPRVATSVGLEYVSGMLAVVTGASRTQSPEAKSFAAAASQEPRVVLLTTEEVEAAMQMTQPLRERVTPEHFKVVHATGSGKTEAALAAVAPIKAPLLVTSPQSPTLPGLRPLARSSGDRHRPATWKLAHLRAAARRARER
ncbi:hypothetical protein ABT052_38925 [Streptomyces sp. NPDC002766]|uniref:hypothetical protein n=1 Tax=Streptomyces sp. NPDC002766 TaxID=3154429 RepID=UPI00332EC341